MSERNYWASRTDKHAQEFFWSELKEGRLRQGWGYSPEQDLRIVMNLPVNQRSPDQRLTERQRYMLGQDGGWQENDIVLVPNMPTPGLFSIARITGPYRFEIDNHHEDYGHIREVNLLTIDGIAKSSALVDSKIRSTLRNSGRAWSINHLKNEIEEILNQINNTVLKEQSSNVQRTERALEAAMKPALASLQEAFAKGLGKALASKEWEEVIAFSIETQFPNAQVRHTGGPGEQGADIEVELPNPFGGAPWIIVAQVKDWQGEAGADVLGQLQQAVETRQKNDIDGIARHVIGALLITTDASPSKEFDVARLYFEEKYKVPITVFHGDELFQLILASFMRRYALS